MATDRYYVCEKGHKIWAGNLFDCLSDQANDKKHPCDSCSIPTHIELVFDFADGPCLCKVLASFYEIIDWPIEDGKTREFYPFLIVAENVENGEQYVWSPYWHIDRHPNGTIEKRKYGQYATVVNIDSYSRLLEKAKESGYL
jgi:hypothetical protein